MSAPRLICVTDGSVPAESTQLLLEACDARGLSFVAVDAYDFDFTPDLELRPGDMLYKTAVALAATRVEQFLAEPHVATFYVDPLRAYFDCMNPSGWLDRAGVPVPRSFHCHSMDRERIRAQVERLGGLPVVIKVPGGEGGIGTMVAESFSSLFSLLDFILSRGITPQLIAYIGDAVHWRAVVVGDRVAAAYPNVTQEDDFRTQPDGDSGEYRGMGAVAEDLEATAVAAALALGLEFGGVDLMRHSSGRFYVLEVNMPCYYPQAQLRAGIDVAGAMVDHLLRKSEALLASTGEPGSS